MAGVLQGGADSKALALPLLSMLAQEWGERGIDLCFDAERGPEQVVRDLSADLAAWAAEITSQGGLSGSLPAGVDNMAGRLPAACAALSQLPSTIEQRPLLPGAPTGATSVPEEEEEEEPLLQGSDLDPWVKPDDCDLGALSAACSFNGTLVAALAEGLVPRALWRDVVLDSPESVAGSPNGPTASA